MRSDRELERLIARGVARGTTGFRPGLLLFFLVLFLLAGGWLLYLKLNIDRESAKAEQTRQQSLDELRQKRGR